MLVPVVAAVTGLQTQREVAILAPQRRQPLDALPGLKPHVRPLLANDVSVPAIGRDGAAGMVAGLPPRRPDRIATGHCFRKYRRARPCWRPRPTASDRLR